MIKPITQISSVKNSKGNVNVANFDVSVYPNRQIW